MTPLVSILPSVLAQAWFANDSKSKKRSYWTRFGNVIQKVYIFLSQCYRLYFRKASQQVNLVLYVWSWRISRTVGDSRADCSAVVDYIVCRGNGCRVDNCCWLGWTGTNLLGMDICRICEWFYTLLILVVVCICVSHGCFGNGLRIGICSCVTLYSSRENNSKNISDRKLHMFLK